MIANAGIIVPKKLFDLSVEEWDRVQAVSLSPADSMTGTLQQCTVLCLVLFS